MTEFDEQVRPRGDCASRLATESLDHLSLDELEMRIALLQAEIARIAAHKDRAQAQRAAADALFAKPAAPPLSESAT